MSQDTSPGFTPNMEILGSVELTQVQADLINSNAELILKGSYPQARETFRTIFDRNPMDDTEMSVFAALCNHVVEGNQLEGRPMTWEDIPPGRR